MKIIYIHQYFNTPRDNGGTRSYEMARRLVNWGHQVEMVSSYKGRQENASLGWQVEEESGIRVHRLWVPYSNSMGYSQRIKAFLRFAYSAAKRAASLDGDVVFATSTPLTIAIPGVYAARRRKIPMVFEVRDLWPELPIAFGALRGAIPIRAAKRLERWAYRNSERIVALSPGMKDGIVRTGYPAEKVHVIPNSCDIDLFQVPAERGETFRKQYAWLGDRPLVVYTGTLGQINGVDYMAQVAASMAELDPEVRFLVVGEGAEVKKVRATAEKLGVMSRNFFMISSLPKNLIPDVLSAADLATSLVIGLPELENNSANKFFDALASGTPVAVNYGGWQAELIRNNCAGLVLDGGNPAEGAQVIHQALNDSDWMMRAGEAALRMAVDLFDREKLARDLEQVLLLAIKMKGKDE